MTVLKFESYEISSGKLGAVNPLPNIVDITERNINLSKNISQEERQYFGKGLANNILPYLIQDNYTRERSIRKFNAAILENSKIKAIFLPELGGRLWSLYDKTKKRELLYKNSAFQPANLALRNAWFSGGVEWNIGMAGHHPLTCDSMFAAKSENNNGEPILSLYEYERRRGLAYGINAYLPNDSDILYVKIIVENTSDQTTPMYWWSNIAFPETANTRVIVPTNMTYAHNYEQGRIVMDKVEIPYFENKDISYPQNEKRAKDYFFDIPKEEKKWISAVQADGKGLLQLSTKRLISRKLFLWGMSVGGNNWNKFLSNPGERYIEIQAGIAHTQYEHIPMPQNTVWEWTEAYTAADLDPQKAHSSNWQTAQNAVLEQIEKKFPNDLESYLSGIFGELPFKKEFFHYGSGWGAFENIIRQKQNKKPISKYFEFPFNSINLEQYEWQNLIDSGVLKPINKIDPPKSYNISPYIQELIEKSPETYYTLLHLGIIYISQGKRMEALAAWKKSMSLKPTAWVARNIAMLYFNVLDNKDEACEYIIKAAELAPYECVELIRDVGRILTESSHDQSYIDLLPSLSDKAKEDGRIRLYAAHAYMNIKDYNMAKTIINNDFELADNKEGEVSISDAWFEIYKNIAAESGINDTAEINRLYPLPAHLDFRMDQEI